MANKHRHVAAWFGHAATCLQNSVLKLPRHAAAWIGHAGLGFFDWVHLMLRHAFLLCLELPLLTPFCFTLLVLRSFYLNITYKIKTQVKMPKIGDKQYKTLFCQDSSLGLEPISLCGLFIFIESVSTYLSGSGQYSRWMESPPIKLWRCDWTPDNLNLFNKF